MNAILALLEKLNPNLAKSTVYRVVEYLVLIVLLVGLWQDLTGNLTTAKQNRDEEMKGYAVQLGVAHSEIEALKDEVDGIKKWSKALSDRINRLEDVAIKGHR